MGKRLWVERGEDGSWNAYSDEGAHLTFGKGEGQFNPGDLMKIALAACGALSSQFAIESALGEGKGAKIVIDGTYDNDTDSYLNFNEQMTVDATDADLDEKAADKLKKRIEAHVSKACTVKHTYEQATPVRMDVTIRK